MKMKRPKITAALLRRTATYLVILGVLGAGAFNFNKLRGVQDRKNCHPPLLAKAISARSCAVGVN